MRRSEVRLLYPAPISQAVLRDVAVFLLGQFGAMQALCRLFQSTQRYRPKLQS